MARRRSRRRARLRRPAARRRPGRAAATVHRGLGVDDEQRRTPIPRTRAGSAVPGDHAIERRPGRDPAGARGRPWPRQATGMPPAISTRVSPLRSHTRGGGDPAAGRSSPWRGLRRGAAERSWPGVATVVPADRRRPSQRDAGIAISRCRAHAGALPTRSSPTHVAENLRAVGPRQELPEGQYWLRSNAADGRRAPARPPP